MCGCLSHTLVQKAIDFIIFIIFFHCNLSDFCTYPDFFSWVRWKFKIILEIKSSQPSGSILSISWLFPLVTAPSYTNYTQQMSFQMREIIYGKDQRVNRHRFDGVDPVVLYPFDIHYYCMYALELCPQWMWWGEQPHLLTSLLFHLLLSCWILHSFTTLGGLMCDIVL